MGRKPQTGTVVQVDFPLYSVHCYGGSHFCMAGGGGAAKTGIPNVIECLDVTRMDSMGSDYEGLSRTLTDEITDNSNEAIMNAAISTWKLRDRHVNLAAGMNNKCFVFEVYKEPNKQARKVGSVDSAGEKEYQCSVCWAGDNKVLVTGNSAGTVMIWSFPELKLLHKVTVHKSDVDSIAPSIDGRSVVSCSRDGTMKHIKIETASCEDLFWTSNETQLKAYRCRACAFAPVDHNADSVKLYSVQIPKVLKNKDKPPSFLLRWDARLLPERKALCHEDDTPSCLSVSIDGNYIGIGCLEGHVSIYVAFSLKLLHRVENVHSSFVTGLTFAPVTFSDKPGSVMQSRAFVDYDTILLSISIDKQLKFTAVGSRMMVSVGTAIMLCFLVVLLVGLGIGVGAIL